MKQSCTSCNSAFDITNSDQTFYSKHNIPAPNLCPYCRSQRRFAFRNEKVLYKRNCDLCSKNMISIYSDDKPYPVYCQECFWSDKWNALDYGMEYDIKKPFFKQYSELLNKTPRLAIVNKQSQNSDYCNFSFANKNCYLTIGSHYEEDCMYDHYSTHNKNCVDSFWIYESELSYSCLYSKTLQKCSYLDHSENCQDCHFGVDLKGCKNCLFCSNLRHKEYHILNEPHSKEEYFKKIEEYNLGSYKRYKEAQDFYSTEFRKRFPFRHLYQINCENCEGNNLENCKNLTLSFDSSDSEDCSYCFKLDETYSSMDANCMGYDRSEACYEIISSTAATFCFFSSVCWHTSDAYYCDSSFSCNHLLGCVSLQQKKYCIFNKQYEKKEYQELFQKIKKQMIENKEWGEFFPPRISPFAYNESVAIERFPMNKDEVLKKGWQWKNDDPKDCQKQTYTIPDNISEVETSISDTILSCEECSKNYKIIPEELKFYKSVTVPVPRHCPSCRYTKRLKLRQKNTLHNITCDKCEKEIQSTFGKERKEKVYCEECYLKEVY